VERHSGHINLSIVQLLIVLIEFLSSKLDIKPEVLVRIVPIVLGKAFEVSE
jgi:hypothetical protein